MTQQSTPAFSEPTFEETRREIARHWGWFLALGILLVILGIAAIAFPFLSTIAAKIAIGWIFLVAGIVEVFHAFYVKRWVGFFWNLLIGLLYIVAGGWLAFFPLTGILTLTIVIAALFIAEGVMEFIMGFRVHPHEGWGWLVFSGVAAIATGLLIALNLPTSAVWALGLLAGINLLFSGWSFIFLALSGKARKRRGRGCRGVSGLNPGATAARQSAHADVWCTPHAGGHHDQSPPRGKPLTHAPTAPGRTGGRKTFRSESHGFDNPAPAGDPCCGL
jgi:uncharacterized membrane protein HdeD (DUF308 family)